MWWLLIMAFLCLSKGNELNKDQDETKGIEWLSLTEATARAKETSGTILFLMTKSKKWCKPCTKLTSSLEGSQEFKDMSTKFVLARAIDGEVPKDATYNFDATYVPKILFIDQHGNILKKIINTAAKPEAKYFYKSAKHVVESMQTALGDGSKIDSGFGTKWDWKEPELGFEMARKQQKPIMMIVHQDWCSACQRLKPLIAQSTEMEAFKNVFIFMNTEDDKYTKGEKYRLDGEYYPKIIFMDSNGFVFEDEVNEGTEHTHVMHYYGSEKEVAQSMVRVLRKIVARDEQADDLGFGKQIKWTNFTEAKQIALNEKKPIMLIFQASFCGACKRLKQKLAESWQFVTLSRNFVMVNIGETNPLTDPAFFPDGGYIPRILFLDNNGAVETELTNLDDDYEKNKYAYGSAETVMNTMNRALEMKLGEREVTVKSRGQDLGKDIKWMKFDDGVKQAKKMQVPMFVMFHNDYCLFSATLKQQIRDSKEILALSYKFVMVEVNETESENLGSKFYIDGDYTPRIMFMDPEEVVRPEVNNSAVGNYPTTLFYYATEEEIVDVMKLALETIEINLGNGFGDYIHWKTLDGGLELANEWKRPVMLLIHRPGCPACEHLKPEIKYNRTVWELSNKFIMINLEDSDLSFEAREKYKVDGSYFPRIYFLNYTGDLVKEIHNQDPKFLKYKYSYNKEEQVVRAMTWAVGHFHLQDDESKQSNNENEDNGDGLTLIRSTGLKWLTIFGALKEAQASRKVILFLIGRRDCPSCKAFLRNLVNSEEFKKKANEFVLAETEDDVDRETADRYNVDGAYAPRVFFLDPEGEIMKDIWNKETSYVENKYYHYDSALLLKSMKEALEKLKDWKPKSTPEAVEKSNETKEQQQENKETVNKSEKTEEKSKKKEKKKKAKKQKKKEKKDEL